MRLYLWWHKPPPVIQGSPRSEVSACFCIDQGIMEKDISPSLLPPFSPLGRGGGGGRRRGESVCMFLLQDKAGGGISEHEEIITYRKFQGPITIIFIKFIKKFLCFFSSFWNQWLAIPQVMGYYRITHSLLEEKGLSGFYGVHRCVNRWRKAFTWTAAFVFVLYKPISLVIRKSCVKCSILPP